MNSSISPNLVSDNMINAYKKHSSVSPFDNLYSCAKKFFYKIILSHIEICFFISCIVIYLFYKYTHKKENFYLRPTMNPYYPLQYQINYNKNDPNKNDPNKNDSNKNDSNKNNSNKNNSNLHSGQYFKNIYPNYGANQKYKIDYGINAFESNNDDPFEIQMQELNKQNYLASELIDDARLSR